MTTAVLERAWCVVVPHHAGGARQARHKVASALTGLVSPALLADAIAVAAELVGNAVRHAAPLSNGVIRVAWRLSFGGGVEIRVTDGGAGSRPRERKAAPDAVDGRGLTIVAALADRWGAERDGVGQCVWAHIKPAARRV